MNTLPKFSKTNVSDDELWDEQSRLQAQAKKIVDTTKIESTLSEYGDLSLGGSYELELMVYPDLDYGLVVEKLDRELISNVLKKLWQIEQVRKIATVDAQNFRPKIGAEFKPVGYWLGIEVPFEDDIWGFDLWIMERGPSSKPKKNRNYVEEFSNASQDQKTAALRIKRDLIEKDLYGNKFFSGDVYDAVLDENIKTLDEFLKLKQT